MVTLLQFGRIHAALSVSTVWLLLGCCSPIVTRAQDPLPEHPGSPDATSSSVTDDRSATPAESMEAREAAEPAEVVNDQEPAALPGGKRRTVFQRMTPRQQLRVVFGLTTILLLGLVMILVAWLGARSVRRSIRMADRRRPSATGSDVDDWARKPLVPRVDSHEESP
ncbi:MAG: hypothetical protein FJ295_20215 [Planctomycetes bacterium]|nr:hypothetical protein [Planctomycetota bacterium]